MISQASEALLGSVCGEKNDQIIEVVMVEEEGENRYEIRLLSFGEGIGWYVQKTLPLDSSQAKALAKILSKTYTPTEKKLITQDDIPTYGKVIRWPLA
jgi:hypothetical protein